MKKNRYIWIAAIVISAVLLCLSLSGCKEKACRHAEGEWILDSAATYERDGLRHTECTLCGETLRAETLPMLICTHDSESWIVDVDATYESAGHRYLRCDLCGVTLASEEIPRRLAEAEIAERLSPLLLRVVCYGADGVSEISRGSGFIIDGDGRFITNAHVVRGAFYIRVTDHLGTTYEVDRLYKFDDTSSDYAIGRVKGYSSSVSAVFTTEVGVGDTVYALGYAGGSSEMSMTRGEITDTARREWGKYYYANTAWIDHGSSGGILADEWGRVIGITTGAAGGGFIAVRYHDFALTLENPLGEGSVPNRFFYSSEVIVLEPQCAAELLDVLVHVSEGDGANVTYFVTVKLKEEYSDSIIVMRSDSVDLTLCIDTVFMLSALIPELSDGVEYASATVSLTLGSVGDLRDGVSGRAESALELEGAEHYAVDVAYSVDFTVAEGALIVYDPLV
jgi:hypothetical protein